MHRHKRDWFGVQSEFLYELQVVVKISTKLDLDIYTNGEVINLDRIWFSDLLF